MKEIIATSNISEEEIKLLLAVRNLQPYEVIDIKLKNNMFGEIVWTKTSKQRQEIKFD